LSDKIEPVALVKFVSDFETAYQAGDINQLITLFASTVRTNDQIDLSGVQTEYQAFFESSTERKIQLADLRWEHEGNYVRGVGEYKTSVHRKGEPSVYLEKGKVTLQLENRSGKLQITRFYFSEGVVLDTPQPNQNSAQRISDEELETLIDVLVWTYGAGDIERFMNLFSTDAQTNEQNTVQGIREDYLSLFNSTSFRRISFEDLTWNWDGEKAHGEAAYGVEVRANGEGKIDYYTGQLWIQVERRGGDVRITHFSFVE